MKSLVYICFTVTILATTHSAWAQPESSHPMQPKSGHSSAGSASQIDESLPMYLSSRVAMVVPVKSTQDTLAIGAGAGLVADDGSLFGLRLIWIPKPPPSSLSDSAPQINSAWGPVVEWQNLAIAKGRLSFYTNVAAGFVYGSPESGSSTSPDEPPEKNAVLPILEVGAGLRVVSRKIGHFRTFIAPELGYVLTGQAPYAAINVGIY